MSNAEKSLRAEIHRLLASSNDNDCEESQDWVADQVNDCYKRLEAELPESVYYNS